MNNTSIRRESKALTAPPAILRAPARFSGPSRLVAVVVLLLSYAALLVIAHFTPPNLLQNNENRMAAYVQDILANGQWICPHDASGRLASKPPAYAWLAALAALASHRIGAFALYVPSTLAALAITALLLVAGSRRFGATAGFLAALAWLLSPTMEWLTATARYDGLFALFVLAAALAASRAWETGRGWSSFWLASAGATLVKGPLGLVLGGAGLLAAVWECRSRARAPLRGSHLPGLLWYVLIVGGWFALARWTTGPSLVDRMVNEELVGHALGVVGAESGHHWYRPLASWMERLAPWSVAAVIALGRVILRPDSHPPTRRFERFLFLSIVFGLLIFIATPHRQARLVVPLVPFGALLAGREMAGWTVNWSPRRFWGVLMSLAAAVLCVIAFDAVVQKPRRDSTRATENALRAARYWEEFAGRGFPLTHLGTPIPFQLALNEIRPDTPVAAVAALLRGDTAAFVAVGDPSTLREFGITPENGFQPLAVWPAEGETHLALLGNRPRPDWDEPAACLIGSMKLRLEGLRLVQATSKRVAVRALRGVGSIRITHEGARSEEISLRVEGGSNTETHRTLAPGETWTTDCRSAQPAGG